MSEALGFSSCASSVVDTREASSFMNRCAFYLPELGESELGSPDLTLATEAVSTDQLEPAIKEQDSWLAGLVRRVTSKRRAD